MDFTGEGCQDWIFGLNSFWRKEEANGHSLRDLPLLFPLSTAINHPWFVASARTIFMLCPHNSFHSLPYFVSITSPSTCFPLPLGSQGLLLLAPLHARGLWKCQKHQGVLQPSTPSSCSKSVKLKEKLTTTATLFLFLFFLILEHIRLFPAATKCRNLAQCCLLLLSPPNAAAVRRHCCPHQRYSQCMQELLFHFCTSSQQKRTHLGQSYSCCSLLKDQEMGTYKGTHPAGLHEVASHGVMGPGNLLSFSS